MFAFHQLYEFIKRLLDGRFLIGEAQFMSRIKTFLFAGLVSLAPQIAAATSNDITQMFAGCAGRFSAEVEHAWLVGNHDADKLAEERLLFVELIEASNASDPKILLQWRVETKFAHASLLSLATASSDAEKSLSAKTTAETHLRLCRSLILGG